MPTGFDVGRRSLGHYGRRAPVAAESPNFPPASARRAGLGPGCYGSDSECTCVPAHSDASSLLPR
jgi:hypothetical protein